MIAHILRAIFRRIDRCIDAHITAALGDDLTAVTAAEPVQRIPEDAWTYHEPIPAFEVTDLSPYIAAFDTPIADAAWLAAIDRACRIEAACDEWADEVDALADVELAEMTREGER